MRAKPAFGLDITLNRRARSDVPLDVLIPAHPKDLVTLPYAVSGLRHNVNHPLNKIYVVTADTADARRQCSSLQCELVSESTILPITPGEIDYRPGGVDRARWLFQQLLKLSVDTLAETAHCLIIDADTLLIRPQVFVWRDRCVLPVGDDLHTDYLRAYERLTGERAHPGLSFTAHHILVSVELLTQLKSEIATRHGCTWYNAILRSIDREAHSSVSDYDLYGHWALRHSRRRPILTHWRNIALKRARLTELPTLLPDLAQRYKAVSLHHYDA
jgi:hypothetical protein